jgi:hypothetical protein
MPLGLIPATVAVAVKVVPNVAVTGTPESTVVLGLRLPAFTLIMYGLVVE